jgi:hypothetical protein
MNDTLVIILCETRAHRLTSELFFQNVLDSLHADLALCVGLNKNTDKPNPFYDRATYIWETEEPDDLGEVYDSIKQKEHSPEDWRQLLSLQDLWLGGIQSNQKGSGAFLYWFRWILSQKIKELNLLQKYKWFIVTRSDFMWRIPHPPVNFCDPTKIYIPNGEHYEGFTDRHIIASNKHILDAIDLMEPIIHRPTWLYQAYKEYLGDKIANPETLIKFMLEQRGLLNRVVQFPYVMYTVREINGATRWTEGVYSEEFGYYIKYTREYESYLKYKDEIQEKDDWFFYLK